jgi:RND family efflux transporter MFP subunit
MRRASLALLVLIAATAIGCRGDKPEPTKPPPAKVTVIRPVKYKVGDYWVYNGYLEQTKAAEVRSKVRSYLLKVEFKEGDEVRGPARVGEQYGPDYPGDLLYSLDKVEFDTARRKAEAELAKAEAEIKNWEAQLVQAKADLDRISEAVRGGTESKSKQDEAQAAFDVRTAEKNAAKANRDSAAEALHSTKIQLGYTDIRAKISGRISRTLVDEGTLVQADTTLLATILKVDELYVYFDAPEGDLIAYQRAVIASLSKDPLSEQIDVEVGVTNEEGFPHHGKIDFRENRVENATGTIRIRGKIPNPLLANKQRLLFPGMYARVRVPKGEVKQQPVIPEDCLLSGQEGRFVYVVDADNVVEKRLVTVGATVWKAPPAQPGVAPPSWVAINPHPPAPVEGKQPARTRQPIKSIVAITDGLHLGDRVILDGLQQARPKSVVSPDEWNLTSPPEAPKK